MNREPLFSQETLELGSLFDLPLNQKWYERYTFSSLFSGANYLRIKRLIDILLGISFLIIIIPILLICAIAIKLTSHGPFFYVQERTGKGQSRIKIYKLRTMIYNAEKLRQNYMHLNELKFPDFKIANDPRVTRVGRIIRKFSLDELPQIFNVLKGDMSLVGPRPSSYLANTYDLWQTARFEIKPGVTGLAQISGRSELLIDEKVRYDIAYIENISLWLDLKIIFKTFGVVVKGRNVK